MLVLNFNKKFDIYTYCRNFVLFRVCSFLEIFFQSVNRYTALAGLR